MDPSLYDGREQSLVKHQILERYLFRFALIIGRTWQSITYVDCFSGPWKSQSEKYEDTSFAIAIKQLREAKKRLQDDGIDLKLRAFFIEQNKDSFAQLKRYANEIQDVEIGVYNGTLEQAIDKIQTFIVASKGQTFPFFFIDPKGWTGFALDVIRPLLLVKPCEVLINFMTQHIIRFIDNEESRSSFELLFGAQNIAEQLANLRQEDRADAAVFKYRDAVSNAGGFGFSGIAGILNPLKDRSHFHLIYLSRNAKGLDVFKDAEKKSIAEMESTRAKLEQKKREKQSKQRELFGNEDAPESSYFLALRDRYQKLAITEIESVLLADGRISYDDAWHSWLRFPMVWESDLKEWIKRQSTRIMIEGLSEQQKVPKRAEKHVLVWRTQ